MFCHNCGQQIDDDAGFCPFCGAKSERAYADKSTGGGQPTYGYGQPNGYDANGQPQQYNYNNYGYGAEKPANGLAIAGFVCSFFFALVGLILSIVGLNKSRELQGSGRGLAIAGIVLSIVSMVLAAIMIIVFATTDFYYYYF